MEKENKKATASEKLTKVVAIRISQTDYDIFWVNHFFRGIDVTTL